MLGGLRAEHRSEHRVSQVAASLEQEVGWGPCSRDNGSLAVLGLPVNEPEPYPFEPPLPLESVIEA